MTVVIDSLPPGRRDEEPLMIVFARGSITDPDALARYVEDEMRV
jgi:hypothetical protein